MSSSIPRVNLYKINNLDDIPYKNVDHPKVYNNYLNHRRYLLTLSEEEIDNQIVDLLMKKGVGRSAASVSAALNSSWSIPDAISGMVNIRICLRSGPLHISISYFFAVIFAIFFTKKFPMHKCIGNNNNYDLLS